MHIQHVLLVAVPCGVVYVSMLCMCYSVSILLPSLNSFLPLFLLYPFFTFVPPSVSFPLPITSRTPPPLCLPPSLSPYV